MFFDLIVNFNFQDKNIVFIQNEIKMQKSPAIALLLLLLTLFHSSCASIDVFKENAEIKIRKPYQSFVIINQEVGMRGFSSQVTDAQVQIQLQEALEAHGLVYDKIHPDLVIRYTSNEDPREREIVNNYNPYPFWGYRVWDPWLYNPNFYNNSRRNSTSSYELVQVIIDFIDPKEDKFLMTLTGVTEVSSPKSKNNRILKTTNKVIERFIQELESITN
jgi:hypothetical protein